MGRGSTTGRAIAERRTIHIHDVLDDPEYELKDEARARAGGVRTILTVPLMREGAPIGVITLQRRAVRPFTEKQIELLETFADQAVIAIENVRLFDEVQARTRDLTELLEQQTATSEVLQVISSSPGELEPVFNTILENATRICESQFGSLVLFDGEGFRTVALHNVPPAYSAQDRGDPFVPAAGAPMDRLKQTKQPVHVVDLTLEPAYIAGFKPIVRIADSAGARSIINIPMLKEGELVGAINIYRQEVRPFTDKQIELVSNFAKQAVIAIENTRLLNELRELLEQQTATSEVLQVISSSPSELEPVFQKMLQNATRVCHAEFGTMVLQEKGGFRHVALYNMPPAYVELVGRDPVFHAPPDGPIQRVARTKQPIHVADWRDEPVYLRGVEPARALADVGGARSVLGVPMLKEGELVGVITIYRQEVQPFTDKQIELVSNFAAQAVIAIENTRLLNELRESLEQQTATSEVLGAIASSGGDLSPVFDKLLANALRLCEAQEGILFRIDGGLFETVSSVGVFANALPAGRFSMPPDTNMGRMLTTRETVHDHDLAASPGYLKRLPVSVTGVEIGGVRTCLHVPMLKEGQVVGAFVIFRTQVRPFSDKHIDLTKSFADQAVIAIENTRLLNELRESLEQQTATSEVLQVISSSPGELEPVFGVILENATRVCNAVFGILALRDGDLFRRVASHNVPPAGAEFLRREPTVQSSQPDSPLDRMVRTKRVVHICDVREEPAYASSPTMIALAELCGGRTFLLVPMLKEDELIGMITIYRQEVIPFADNQIELVRNFAKQAVIAIENTRLLNESYANPCNNRPRRPRFLRSSVVRRPSFSRYFNRCSKMQPASARLSLEHWFYVRMADFAAVHITTRRLPLWKSCNGTRFFTLTRTNLSAACCERNSRFKSLT